MNADYPLVGADTETAGLEAAYDVTCKLHCLTVYDLTLDAPVLLTKRDDIQRALDTYTMCFVNAKFDVAVLRTHGYTVPRYHDLAIANYVLTGCTSSENHALGSMAQTYLGHGKDEKPTDWADFNEHMQAYALTDCKLTHELIPHTLTKLRETSEHAYECYLYIELPYVDVLVDMLHNGTYVDADVITPLIPVYEEAIDDLVHEHTSLYGFERGAITKVTAPAWKYVNKIPVRTTYVKQDNGTFKMHHEYAKCDIAPVSLRGGSRQRILTERYPDIAATLATTKSGLLKTDKSTLSAIADRCPAADIWLEYEKATKQLGSFLLPLRTLAADNNGIVRCSMHNYNTRTGRLSCSTPNLQQVPSEGERGAEIRKAFVAPPGYSVVVGDLDRIEIAVLAFYLLTLLNHGELAQRALSDVHQLNADAWSCSRPAAKRGIFATVYGVGPAKLARVIRTNVNNAKNVLNAIRRDLRLDEYTECFVEYARNNDGFIVNYFGLRMYIPELLSRDRNEREAGKRKCGNYPIQSTAGALFKYMQIAARGVINGSSTLAPNVMQTLVVHDEVIYIVKDAYVGEFVERVTPCYNSSTLLPGVNVALSFGVGKNWYEAK